jgi:hypothetical protein
MWSHEGHLHIHFNCLVAVLRITNFLPDDDPVGSKHVAARDVNNEI